MKLHLKQDQAVDKLQGSEMKQYYDPGAFANNPKGGCSFHAMKWPSLDIEWRTLLPGIAACRMSEAKARSR